MADWVRARAQGWLARVSFALVLLVFSEFGVREAPDAYGPGRWLVVVAIYLALAALALDLLVRLRVNEVLSLFLVAGLYGLANSLLISHAATQDIPMSLIGRPLAAHPIGFLLALAAFRILASGRATGPLDFGLALLAGLAWGVWVRWLPHAADDPALAADFEDAVFALALGLTGIAVLRFVLAADVPRVADDWRLLPLEGAIMSGGLVAALAAGIASEDITAPGWGIVVTLLAYIMMLLWVTLPLRGPESVLDAVTPPRLPNLVAWLVLVIPALAMGWLGYHLPGSGDHSTASDLLFGALLGIGLVWLPGVSAVLGVRAVVRLARQGW